jgi:hypothetical protein
MGSPLAQESAHGNRLPGLRRPYLVPRKQVTWLGREAGAKAGKLVLLTFPWIDDTLGNAGGHVAEVDTYDSSRLKLANPADEEKVLPWAEGNGLWSVISTLASDLVGVDVVTFFVQNPYACDTAESVAVRIGRDFPSVARALEDLTAAQLLEVSDLGRLCVYTLTEDPHRRQTLQQYVAWLQEGYHWARLAMDR